MDQYRFNKHLQSLGVFNSARVLVAVSGGMDSMSLLHALCTAALTIRCTVAHVNFHLRGAESDADQELVEAWCREQGIACLVKHANTVEYAKDQSISIEMAARNIRYAWFDELMKQGAHDFLAIAHNANDNAETLILNLVRGTGIKGLCGITAKREKLIRPLLVYPREEIAKHVAYFSIPYRTDHTNLESDFARNRVRNKVFPQLKQINPSLVKTLNRNICYFSMASGMLEKMINSEKKRLFCTVLENGKGLISIKELLMVEYWPYFMYEILQEFGFNSAQVEDVVNSITDVQVQRIFSKECVLVKERGEIKIYDASFALPLDPIVIPTVGLYSFAKKNLLFELQENSPEFLQTLLRLEKGVLAVCADALEFPLICRTMIAGDKFTPFGMKGSKNVSDFLTDLKIDHILRQRIPILLNGTTKESKNPGDDIICLPGLRIDSRYKVTTDTRRVLMIRISQ